GQPPSSEFVGDAGQFDFRGADFHNHNHVRTSAGCRWAMDCIMRSFPSIKLLRNYCKIMPCSDRVSCVRDF
ncbi:MAG: hypothetical protein LH702_31230, partial [Phormidesmis sp. CAN_BIN44]|nr:hypothetical protein [Phormidesmis sp. CAN_BIN44]